MKKHEVIVYLSRKLFMIEFVINLTVIFLLIYKIKVKY